jgi:hypothetical protein
MSGAEIAAATAVGTTVASALDDGGASGYNKAAKASLRAGDLYRQAANQGISTLKDYNNVANAEQREGLAQSQSLGAPYNVFGLNALGDYGESMGLDTPEGGYFGLQQQLEQGRQLEQQLQGLQGGNSSVQKQRELLKQRTSGNLLPWGVDFSSSHDPNFSYQNLGSNIDNMSDEQVNQLFKKVYQQTKQVGDSGKTLEGVRLSKNHGGWQDLQNWLGQAGEHANVEVMSPDQRAQQLQAIQAHPAYSTYQNYKQGKINYGDPNTPGGGNRGAEKFLNSPLASLIYKGYDQNKSLADNFQESPDYTWQKDQIIRAGNAAASAKGYLDSPRAATELQDRAGGLASQYWDNYREGFENVFNNYQGNLRDAAGMGQNQSLASQQQIGNTYNNIAANTANTGQNIAGLQTSIGENNASAQLGYGKAKTGESLAAYNNRQNLYKNANAAAGLFKKG